MVFDVFVGVFVDIVVLDYVRRQAVALAANGLCYLTDFWLIASFH